MRAPLRSLALLAAGLIACGSAGEPEPLPPMPHSGAPVPLPDDPAREFDFWAGTWNVQNKHVTSDGNWEETGTAVARIDLVAGGRAVLERWSGEARSPLHGFSLRSWDPELGKCAGAGELRLEPLYGRTDSRPSGARRTR